MKKRLTELVGLNFWGTAPAIKVLVGLFQKLAVLWAEPWLTHRGERKLLSVFLFVNFFFTAAIAS